MSCIVPHSALAQGNDGKDDTIVVTGSRIRGVAPVGSSIISVGQDAIAASGATTASDVLKQIPQITSLSINAEGATGQGASSNITRATGPNLRGLGQTATLVLLDGNRVPISGTQGNFVDPSMLPTLALERIEVIADGASAIYGSDAVAGVINLIPRKSFKGLQIRARGGFADGYHNWQVSGITGADWGSGHLVVAAEWLGNDTLLTSERDYLSANRTGGGGSDARTTACSPATITAGGTTYAVPASSGRALNFNDLTAGTVNRCDPERLSSLIPHQERKSAYAYLTQSLNENVSIFAQGIFSRRKFSGPLNGQPTIVSLRVPTTNPWYPANAPSGPLYASFNLLDLTGPQMAWGTSQTWQVLAGGDVSLGRWNVKLTASTGDSLDEMERTPGVAAASLSALMARSDPSNSFNPFYPDENDPAMVKSLMTSLFNPKITNRLRTLSLEGNGPLFTLPGGDVRMAVGGSMRGERSFGPFTIGTISSPIRMPSDISRTSESVYGEFYVPLVGSGNAMAGIQALDLSLALRYEHYSDFGSTTNPKIGLNWTPVQGLKLRGSYGTSFRAPGLSEINPNSSGAGFRDASLTVPGRTLPVAFVLLAAGNPNLKPEKAKTWSLGFDLTPPSLPGLRLSGTYFNVAYRNQVVDVYTMIPQVVAELGNYPTIAFLNDGSARWASAVALIRSTPYYTEGSINFNEIGGFIDARKQNLGKTKASGLDLDLSYRFSSGENDFSLAVMGTRFFTYAYSTGTGALIDRLNTYGNPQRFRARALAGWSRGGISAQATLNYLNSYTNMTSALVRNVSSYTTVDLNLGYAFKDTGSLAGLQLAVNATNLFDRKPPFVDAGLGYDPSAASAIGRMISLSVTKSF